jgi:formate--tetrahydrofolate ligase
MFTTESKESQSYQTETKKFPSDLQIARRAQLAPMEEVAAGMGIGPHLLEPYGGNVSKVKLAAIDELSDRPRAKYVVVSAVTPTPLGEGKTTTTVGLGQAFSHLGKKATVAVRQPSMGPTFGIKGGAAGGGYSQVVPMETLNLHLTGDMHAVTAAHNLLSAMVDNHIHQGGEPRLDPRDVRWRRVMDVNDRSLRNIVGGLGARGDGVPNQTGFDITAASEVMAVLALADSLSDLRSRLGRIVVANDVDGYPVTAEDIKAAGAMAVILREALKPNLMQTLENTPVLVHAGPFGNIAHGNSSIVADRIGIRGGDYLITEAGFGADMGAERFFNIKCRASGLAPDAAVLVATVRALKVHSGRHKVAAGKPLPPELLEENPDDVYAGADNLRKQISNIKLHGVSPVVAINAFPKDHASEHAAIREVAEEMGVRVAVSDHFTEGGRGATELAEAVAEAAEEPSGFALLYPNTVSLREKIETVASEVYGASGVDYSPLAAGQLDSYEKSGYGNLPVCIAKTHLSISSDPTLLGAPKGWTLPVREARLSAGAGFVYPICGEMRTMPGLSATPAAEGIDLDENGEVVGLS